MVSAEIESTDTGLIILFRRIMKVYDKISDLIGSTPLIKLDDIDLSKGVYARILGKTESFNPGGSVKDRIAKAMILKAIEQGKIHENTVIVEPTSGNTGIGLALMSASLGLKIIIVMPDTMSVERRNLLLAYGAKLVLTDGKLGMQGAIDKAKEIADSTPNSFVTGQFVNPENPNAHYLTTGPEIWNDTDGRVDVFVAGVGTGGTVSGTGKYLKEKNSSIKIVAVEPSGSPFLSSGSKGKHGIQGIGAGFKPDTLDLSVVDEIVTVSDEDAYSAGRALARTKGVLVGVSSGAAYHVAKLLAKNEKYRGKTIVVLLPDTGERYLSTPMFTE